MDGYDVELRNATKRFGDVVAVDDVSLAVKTGEFVSIIGPSGCGKTTTMRMIAGLDQPDAGEVIIRGQAMQGVPPYERNVALVFQSFALFPHLDALGNVEFGLRMRGVDKKTRRERALRALQTVGLGGFERRRVGQLSGGQRQRVAMGRAIVRDPSAFLMDEPLSNLDAKLRVQMRTEVSRIQKNLGTTTIYVTHDQTEAMTLGDRVAVMRSGMLQQVGSPMELYNHPLNLFVAGFIGSPAMNFMPATVDGDTIKLPIGDVRLPDEIRGRVSGAAGKNLIAGIRPENFEDAALVGEVANRGSTFQAHIEVLESLGSELYAHFTVASDQQIESQELRELAEDVGGGEVPMAGEAGRIVARLEPASQVRVGQEAELWVDATRVHLFDPDDGRNLTTDAQGPSALDGQGGGGRDPEVAPPPAGTTDPA